MTVPLLFLKAFPCARTFLGRPPCGISELMPPQSTWTMKTGISTKCPVPWFLVESFWGELRLVVLTQGFIVETSTLTLYLLFPLIDSFPLICFCVLKSPLHKCMCTHIFSQIKTTGCTLKESHMPLFWKKNTILYFSIPKLFGLLCSITPIFVQVSNFQIVHFIFHCFLLGPFQLHSVGFLIIALHITNSFLQVNSVHCCFWCALNAIS